MVRGMLISHVMEAVSKEMFGGARGRVLVEQAQPQVGSVDVPPAQQQRRVREMLRTDAEVLCPASGGRRAANAGGPTA